MLARKIEKENHDFCLKQAACVVKRGVGGRNR
jgi:hypothetical protein